MYSMAEVWYKDGTTQEFFVTIILAPDTVLTLFLDGSSVLETTRNLTVFESVW